MIHEAQITHIGISDKGEEKVFKENYIIEDAETFTEVEYILVKELLYPNLDIVAIKRSRIKEIANKRARQEEVLWQAELQDNFVDDDGNKKNIRYKVVFYSTSFDMAKRYIAEYSSQGYDLELVSLKKTNFKDVIAL